MIQKEVVFEQFNVTMKWLNGTPGQSGWNLMSRYDFEEDYWPRVERGLDIMRHNGIEFVNEQRNNLDYPYLVVGDKIDFEAVLDPKFRRYPQVQNLFPDSGDYSDLRKSYIARLVSDMVGKDPFLSKRLGIRRPRGRWQKHIDMGGPVRISFNKPDTEIKQFVNQMAQEEGIQIRQVDTTTSLV
jgi:hypothetical protein